MKNESRTVKQMSGPTCGTTGGEILQGKHEGWQNAYISCDDTKHVSRGVYRRHKMSHGLDGCSLQAGKLQCKCSYAALKNTPMTRYLTHSAWRSTQCRGEQAVAAVVAGWRGRGRKGLESGPRSSINQKFFPFTYVCQPARRPSAASITHRHENEGKSREGDCHYPGPS